MQWRILVVVVLLAPAVAGCQVTPEFVRAALCEPVEPPEVGDVPPLAEPGPFVW